MTDLGVRLIIGALVAGAVATVPFRIYERVQRGLKERGKHD